MKPIPVLGIPHFNRPDLLARCIASIDYPVTKLVIINNGPAEHMVDFTTDDMFHHFTTEHLGKIPACIDEIEEISHPNAGVAGAWNEIIKLYPAEWWMLVNNDIQFAPGDLGKMAELMESGKAEKPLALAYGNHGASWFGISAYGVKYAGLYDENFYPAYLEDCDMHYRMTLLDLRMENVPGVRAVHGDEKQGGSCTVNATPELAAKNSRTHGGNFEYYRQKWSGINGQEKYLTPFGMPGVPVSYWTFDPIRRKNQQW